MKSFKNYVFVFFVSILGTSFLTGCDINNGGTSSSNADSDISIDVSVPDGFERIDINPKANTFEFEGLGAQMDVCMFTGSYCGLDGIDGNITDEDVAIWKQRLEYMNIDCTRMCIIPDWYELTNDNNDPNVLNEQSFNWNTIKMQAVNKVLDLCKEFNIKVNMSWYGTYPTSWNANQYDLDHNPGWLVWPEDDEEFAESVYAALKHFNDTGYSNVINEISFYPEPVTSRVNDGSYAKMITAVSDKLEKEGIRKNYILSGPAEVSNYSVFENLFDTVGDIFDRYTGSFYKFNSRTDNASLNMGIAPFSELAATVNKPYGVSEFGSNEMISAAAQKDIDTYARALYISRFVTSILNSGYTYASYWVLGNAMYDGTLMDLGLWKYKSADWALRPQYYSYSLITRYTEPGSRVYQSSVSLYDDVSMAALKSPDGKWTYIINNNGSNMRKISIVNPLFLNGSLTKYEITEDSVPLGGQKIGIDASGTVNLKNGCANLSLKTKSILVLTNMEK